MGHNSVAIQQTLLICNLIFNNNTFAMTEENLLKIAYRG